MGSEITTNDETLKIPSISLTSEEVVDIEWLQAGRDALKAQRNGESSSENSTTSSRRRARQRTLTALSGAKGRAYQRSVEVREIERKLQRKKTQRTRAKEAKARVRQQQQEAKELTWSRTAQQVEPVPVD